jgi:outer membrane protein TolC
MYNVLSGMRQPFWFILFLLLPLLCTEKCFSQVQDTLSLEQAIRIGLENNFSIRISRNNANIAENNRTIGNAGFLPAIEATGSRNISREDTRQQFTEESGIPNRTTSNAQTINTGASASLNWTIFDGFTMFATYDKLGDLEALGEQQFRLTVENSVARVIGAYYNIIRQKNIYDVLESTLNISEQRIDIAETRLDLGSGSEYDLLQARADFSEDRAAVIRQEVLLNDGKVLLNELLAREVDLSFKADSVIPINEGLVYNELVQQALKDNLDLSIARTNQDIVQSEIKEIRGERFPELDLNAGYSFNRNESGSGFLELNETDGFNYGLTARINLFDGFNVNRRIENAKIRLQNQKLAIEGQKQGIKADILREFKKYQNSLRLVELESENLKYARRSLDIALERFRLGSINSIELREVQRTLIDAESRLIQAQFEAKLAETELLRLASSLTESISIN